jgi:hypothetical protein
MLNGFICEVCKKRSKRENDITLKEKNSVLCAGVFVCAAERMCVCWKKKILDNNNIK